MIAALRLWWDRLSLRERRLIQFMLAGLAAMVLWLGLWRPLHAGAEAAQMAYDAALDRNSAIRAQVAALGHRRSVAPTGVDALRQSAGEIGLVLDRAEPAGSGRIALTIGAARGGALLAWLAGLEARGHSVETLSLRPGATPGTMAADILLRTGT